MRVVLVLLAAFLHVCRAVPYIHASVKKELDKGPEAVIMVTFTAANIEAAFDPRQIMDKMKRRKRIPQDMELSQFLEQKLYDEMRGVYVHQRVTSRHESTRRMLNQLLPPNSIISSISISNLFLLRNTPGTFEQLKDRDDVVEINTDQKFTVSLEEGDLVTLSPRGASARLKRMLAVDHDPEVQWNLRKIGVPEAWRLGGANGARGEGVVYAVADTGVSFSHPILRNYRGLQRDGTYEHNYSWWDGVREKVPNADPSSCPVAGRKPCDDQGHGTHCASIAIGAAGFGVAPGARWIGCRNMDAGLGSTITYLSCLNFFLAPHDLDGKNARPDLRPHVVGNSYGCPDYEGCSKHAMTAAVKILRAAGIFMSVSAGNDGPDCSTLVSPPSFEPQVVSVGATDIHDYLAPFSSRGPVKMDGITYTKPDLVAPGVEILGAYLNNSYRRFSGTSMASPHLGGAVSLMMSQCPCLGRDIDRIQAILESTAVKLYPTPALMRQGKYCGADTNKSYPNNYFGYGRIDVLRAVQACRDFCASRPPKSSLASFTAEPVVIFDSSNVLKRM